MSTIPIVPPGCGQIERGGRAEAAGAQQEHLRPEETLLAFLSDLRKKQMPLVPVALSGVERPRAAQSRPSSFTC